MSEEEKGIHAETLIVSYTVNESGTTPLLVVGKKKYLLDVDIVNAIAGKRATELFNELKTPAKEG